ncbi:MAG: response regulator transcription factor [Gemmatimonadaceae bacterium]|nr:response regulator transcription factor [Gemmatimonadaceae bacterium]
MGTEFPASRTDASAPWRVVVLDDEPPALIALRAALQSAPDFTVVAESHDPLSALTVVRAAAPDVLFVDMQMPGMTGIEFVRQLGADVPLVVFVTAYDQYAVHAFEAEAVDYVLKPIDPERFRLTLDRLRRRLRDGDTVAQLAPLRGVLERLERAAPAPSSSSAPTKFLVRRPGRVTFVDVAQIDRVESDNNDVRLFIGREQLQSRETLSSIEQRLPADGFVRVHRSCIVNLARVRHVEPYFHGDLVLVLQDGSKITTGRSYRDRVRRVLGLD